MCVCVYIYIYIYIYISLSKEEVCTVTLQLEENSENNKQNEQVSCFIIPSRFSGFRCSVNETCAISGF